MEGVPSCGSSTIFGCTLPNSVIFLILRHIPPLSLIKLFRISKCWHQLLTSENDLSHALGISLGLRMTLHLWRPLQGSYIRRSTSYSGDGWLLLVQHPYAVLCGFALFYSSVSFGCGQAGSGAQETFCGSWRFRKSEQLPLEGGYLPGSEIEITFEYRHRTELRWVQGMSSYDSCTCDAVRFSRIYKIALVDDGIQLTGVDLPLVWHAWDHRPRMKPEEVTAICTLDERGSPYWRGMKDIIALGGSFNRQTLARLLAEAAKKEYSAINCASCDHVPSWCKPAPPLAANHSTVSPSGFTPSNNYWDVIRNTNWLQCTCL